MPTCNALILVTPTDGEAFHTGRTLHRVECSAHGLIHPGTTGPDQWSSSHHRTGETWPVDRPAPTPAPAPGLDLEAAEKRAAGFRGTFRVMAYDSGDELLEYVSLDRDIGDDVSDVDEIAQFACDDAVQRAIVDTLNDAPALIAEVRRLRAQVCRLVSGQWIESDALCQHHDADLEARADVETLREKLAKARRLGMDACDIGDAETDRNCLAIRAALEAL